MKAAKQKKKINVLGAIKDFFVGMFKNKVCIDNGKRPWYFALIYVVILLSLLWIPPFYRFNTTRGSFSLGSKAGIDQALVQLVTNDDYKFNESSFSEDHLFVPSEEFKAKAKFDTENYTGGLPIELTTQSSNNAKIQILKVFYVEDINPKTKDGASQYRTYVSNLFKKKDEQNNVTDIARYSIMVLTPYTIEIDVFGVGEQKVDSRAIAAFYGQFDKVKAEKISTIIYQDDANIKKDQFAVFENIQLFLDDCYYPTKYREMVTYLIIYEVGTVLISFLVGIALFIFSRMKNSAYKSFSFWSMTKAGAMMTFTPGIITFVALFLLGNTYGTIVLIGCTVLRLFFSYRKINPKYQDPNKDKPLYQART